MKTNQVLAILALAGGLFAAFTSYSEKNDLYPTWKFESERVEGKKVDYISAMHLSELLYAKDQGIKVLDFRSESEYNSYHIPSALLYEKAKKGIGQEKYSYMVYGLASDLEARELQKKLNGKVYVLEGGIEAWKSLVLFPDFNHFRVRNREALEQIIRRSRYFGGTPGNTQMLNIEVRQTRYREGC